jgi:hypothetical protein
MTAYLNTCFDFSASYLQDETMCDETITIDFNTFMYQILLSRVSKTSFVDAVEALTRPAIALNL